MRMALLSGARPKVGLIGPSVRLIRGRWLVNIEGHIDAEVTLDVGGHLHRIAKNTELHLEKSTDVFVRLDRVGAESSITVIATKVAA